jgi:AmmeMemoRadiSam system protein B
MSSFLRAQHHPACYPSQAKAALAYFRAALEDENSAPNLTVAPRSRKASLAGIIAPHIDFRVSLAAHAVAFRPLLAEPLAEQYLILGVGHRSDLEWNLDRRDYETPLGRATCVTDLVDALVPPASERRLLSPRGHEAEHSIEFPLLWLQAVHQLHGSKTVPEVRFVPLLCGGMHAYVEGQCEWDDLEDFHHLSRALADLFQKQPPGRQLRIIVSIDGCHLGPRFQHPFPVTSTLLKVTEGWEKLLWTCAEKGDVRAFLDWFRVEGNDRYFDGVGALALLMASGRLTLERTYYEQWFTPQDASAVTFSSGLIFSD